jgi:hypothetical protein
VSVYVCVYVCVPVRNMLGLDDISDSSDSADDNKKRSMSKKSGMIDFDDISESDDSGDDELGLEWAQLTTPKTKPTTRPQRSKSTKDKQQGVQDRPTPFSHPTKFSDEKVKPSTRSFRCMLPVTEPYGGGLRKCYAMPGMRTQKPHMYDPPRFRNCVVVVFMHARPCRCLCDVSGPHNHGR